MTLRINEKEGHQSTNFQTNVDNCRYRIPSLFRNCQYSYRRMVCNIILRRIICFVPVALAFQIKTLSVISCIYSEI